MKTEPRSREALSVDEKIAGLLNDTGHSNGVLIWREGSDYKAAFVARPLAHPPVASECRQLATEAIDRLHEKVHDKAVIEAAFAADRVCRLMPTIGYKPQPSEQASEEPEKKP